jgi:RsiW-degrading membrane proteinase PrsW (M82 family)
MIKSMPLDYVKALVIIVVIYTAAILLRSAKIERRQTAIQQVASSTQRG